MTHYGTLVDALAYHAARGNAAWSATGVTDDLREAALLRSSEAIDGIYSKRFSGRKASRSQDRAWPRIDAVDHCANEPIAANEIPVEVETATYALALAELVTPGSTTPSMTLGRVTQSEKADVLGRSFFGPGDGVEINADTLRPTFTVVEDALRCLMMADVSTGGTRFLDRV